MGLHLGIIADGDFAGIGDHLISRQFAALFKYLVEVNSPAKQYVTRIKSEHDNTCHRKEQTDQKTDFAFLSHGQPFIS